MKNVETLLNRAWAAYAKGEPFLTDDEFDALAKKFDYTHFEEGKPLKKAKHKYPMYSLKKVFDDEPSPLESEENVTESPKLDGAAISLFYEEQQLVRGITRGDGVEGEDITDKVYLIDTIPKVIDQDYPRQIDGEIVVSKKIENARNYASGALHLKSNKEFKETRSTQLIFVAYSIRPYLWTSYYDDMMQLEDYGFLTILDGEYCRDFFRTDGTVIRLNNNGDYGRLGYTAKHPRGAYARKLSSDVEIVETVLLDVIWQVGRTGQVTPVAIFEDIVIDDAVINRATLHNVGILNELNLEIGDLILVTRSGGIIPKVLGKA